MGTLIKLIILTMTLLSLVNTYIVGYSYKHYLVVIVLGVVLYGVFTKYSKYVDSFNVDIAFVSAIALVATLLGAFIPNKTINQGLYASFYMYSVMSIGYFWVGLQKLKDKNVS